MLERLEKNYTVRSYEVAPSGRASIVTLLNYLQDAASEHAEKLGFSVSTLQEKGITWLLSRYRVRILRYPRINDKLMLHTWISGRDKWTTTRELELFNPSGTKLLEATTKWALLDLNRGRPAKVEGSIPDCPILERRLFDQELTLPGSLENADEETSFRVRYNELDLNNHVNNAIYIAWALECVPIELLQTMLPKELEIAYRAAATYGDTILSRIKSTAGNNSHEYLHDLQRVQDCKELVRMRSLWQPAADFD